MSESNSSSSQAGGHSGHRRLADRILDAMEQAEGQGRTEIADRLRRVHNELVDSETRQYAHRRAADDA